MNKRQLCVRVCLICFMYCTVISKTGTAWRGEQGMLSHLLVFSHNDCKPKIIMGKMLGTCLMSPYCHMILLCKITMYLESVHSLKVVTLDYKANKNISFIWIYQHSSVIILAKHKWPLLRSSTCSVGHLLHLTHWTLLTIVIDCLHTKTYDTMTTTCYSCANSLNQFCWTINTSICFRPRFQL